MKSPKKIILLSFLFFTGLSLTACQNKQGLNTSPSRQTQISSSVSQSPQEESDLEKTDISKLNIPKKIIMNDDSIWKKDSESDSYVGTFSGEKVMVEQPGIKNVLHVVLKIDKDGSFNSFTYVTSEGSSSATIHYLDKNDQLQTTHSCSQINYSTGVIVRQYGELAAGKLLDTLPFIYINESGTVEIQENYITGYEYPDFEVGRVQSLISEYSFDDNMINYDTKTNGNIVLSKNESVTSADESLYQKEQAWAKETEVRKKYIASKSISNQNQVLTYDLKNQNDFLQFIQRDFSTGMTTIDVEILDASDYQQVYLKDNTEIKAKYVIKTSDTLDHNDIYIYDGQTIYSGDPTEEPISLEKFIYYL